MKNHNLDAWSLVDYYMEPLKKYLSLEGVSEIWINKYNKVYIEQFGQKKLVDVRFDSEQTVQTLIMQIGNALGQPTDPETHPILDARLKDGSRVCAVLYPVAPLGSNLTIRVFPEVRLDVKSLIESGSVTADMMEYLKLAVLTRSNMLVSGGTGSGKTTLLNILSSFIPAEDRVVTVEDTQELQVSVDNLVMLEAPRRRKGKGDAQKVDMAFLIRTTLRQKPDRILVGEIRDMEAATAFLHAINTGHSGVCSTIHANSCDDALVRMQTLIAGSGSLPWNVLEVQVKSNLNVLIHAAGTQHGRRIVQVAEIQNSKAVTLWDFDYVEDRHNFYPQNLESSEVVKAAIKHGVEVPERRESC
jgi:pilus assembly protein CpaF